MATHEQRPMPPSAVSWPAADLAGMELYIIHCFSRLSYFGSTRPANGLGVSMSSVPHHSAHYNVTLCICLIKCSLKWPVCRMDYYVGQDRYALRQSQILPTKNKWAHECESDLIKHGLGSIHVIQVINCTLMRQPYVWMDECILFVPLYMVGRGRAERPWLCICLCCSRRRFASRTGFSNWVLRLMWLKKAKERQFIASINTKCHKNAQLNTTQQMDQWKYMNQINVSET